MFAEALLVGLGAALGSMIRWALTEAVGVDLPAILAVNVLGCALMGFFRPGPFWGTGFLGGFTTMSAYALLTAQLPALQALCYTLLTVFGCVGAALLGRRLSRGRAR
ncbi:fluoride efflux transporter family protein [Corynebacterium doosanense]|uniref:Fluoride-specific ion channel FluC n=1 Tax=Corynebacterium doosanense CAU 212 = DSM 45436 TaxID=558173 RepID=A0A097II06_9CORY|nr:fluoride efflux transporter family protein [Corynebacterium doosanense]AIT61758.1 camphor resistance protein CrcB [Corynebacterium doosanense CAU 212 = DSM 45436]